MNFDPRSAHLNTELGFIIDSPALAQAVGRAFDTEIQTVAYAVRLDEQGDLVWIERRDGQEIRHTPEPGSSLGQRARIGLLSVLPIEWLL